MGAAAHAISRLIMARAFRISVVAAVIESNGRVLIAQRKRGARHGLKWEFPGGKVEAGETPRAALARELREELGIDAEIGVELARYDFSYPQGTTIQLIFLSVRRFQGEPSNEYGIFEQIRWESRTNLPGYDFLEGDVEFVRLLAAGRL